MIGLLGILIFTLIAWGLSENRKAIAPKRIAVGIVLQFAIAFVFLKLPVLNDLLLLLNGLVEALDRAKTAGSSFMFGYLGGGATPFDVKPGSSTMIIAFQILPIILLMSAISAVLYHWGLLQKLVQAFSIFLKKSLRISGTLGFGVSANVYFGIVEAPLLLRPYLKSMTRSELFTVMSAGMATVAGTVMVLYASILNPIVPGAIGHILIASLISAPAVIVLAQLIVPETKKVEDEKAEDLALRPDTKNTVDALVQGTTDGIQLLLNVAAMILVLFALVSLLNQGLALLPSLQGEPITIQRLLGYIFRPLVWLMGISGSEATVASNLMGTKLILNEFVAYLEMAKLPSDALSERSRLILTYAMCGFANLASLGLIVGAMSSMVPERRTEISVLAIKSVACGILATMMTGAVVGILH